MLGIILVCRDLNDEADNDLEIMHFFVFLISNGEYKVSNTLQSVVSLVFSDYNVN